MFWSPYVMHSAIRRVSLNSKSVQLKHLPTSSKHAWIEWHSITAFSETAFWITALLECGCAARHERSYRFRRARWFTHIMKCPKAGAGDSRKPVSSCPPRGARKRQMAQPLHALTALPTVRTTSTHCYPDISPDCSCSFWSVVMAYSLREPPVIGLRLLLAHFRN